MELKEKLNLKRVELTTNISREEKKHLLAKVKIFVYTSIREGWGQTVIEAASYMTPTVAYSVPGLKDSVKHLKTGVLIAPGDIKQLAKTITHLLTNHALRNRLAENAYRHAQQYSWDKTAKTFLKAIEGVTCG